jgi:tetratricopeptide (TPR) repeat protein
MGLAVLTLWLAVQAVVPPDAAPAPPSKKEQAATLLLGGEASKAAALYSEILAATPDDPDAMAGRVRALIAADDWRTAVDEARRYAAAPKATIEVRASLGEALYRAGRLVESAGVLDPIAADEKAPVRALVTAGLLRATEGKGDEAGVLLERAVAAGPRDRIALYWAAGAAESRAKSIELLNRYLEVSEGDDRDRIDGVKGTLDLYKALGERPTWVPVSRPERMELPLRVIADRPGRLDGFVVDATLAGGKKVSLLLDSGSTGLFLVDRIATRGAFEALSSETVFGGGGEGRTSSRRGLLPSFALGEMSFRDALVTAGKNEVDPTGRFQGVLGLWIFDGYTVVLDLKKGRLVLEPPGTSPEGTAYWSVGGQMLVEAGASDGQKGLFLFDTGATTTLLSRSLAEASPKAILGEATRVRGYGGALKGSISVRGLGVSFLGLTPDAAMLNAVDLTMRSHLGGVEISGFLGLDLLEGTRIVIDTKARRIAVGKPEKR